MDPVFICTVMFMCQNSSEAGFVNTDQNEESSDHIMCRYVDASRIMGDVTALHPGKFFCPFFCPWRDEDLF